MTITNPTPNHENIDIHLKNLETVLFKVDKLDELTIDSSDLLSKKAPPGYFSFITNYWSTDDTEKIKTSLLQMLSSINKDRKSFEKTSTNIKIRDSEIRALITNKFVPAGESFFNPICLWRMKNIQNILAPRLKELREKKQSAIEESRNVDSEKGLTDPKTEFYNNNPDYKMDVAVEKANLMFLLKIGIDINDKGATGSTIISWFGRKKIAIFKPENRHVFLTEIISNQWKYMMGWQISHFKNANDAQPKAEVAAHILATHFGLDITCPTRLETLGKSEGSFQLWAQGMEEIEEIYELLESETEFHPLEILLFNMMVIADYILANLDCHRGNYLIKKGKNLANLDYHISNYFIKKDEKLHFIDLRKIDNANTFITHNPTRKMITDSKQYEWKSWKIAKAEFCKEAKDIMLKMTEDAINEVVHVILDKLPGFLNHDIITLLKQRAKVLLIAGGLENFTPSELGELQTNEEIERFIRKNTLTPDESKITKFCEISESFAQSFEQFEEYVGAQVDNIEFKKTSSDSEND